MSKSEKDVHTKAMSPQKRRVSFDSFSPEHPTTPPPTFQQSFPGPYTPSTYSVSPPPTHVPAGLYHLNPTPFNPNPSPPSTSYHNPYRPHQHPTYHTGSYVHVPVPATTYHQPQAVQPMSTSGVGNLNARGMPVRIDGTRDWSNRTGDCFGDCNTCLTACCCPCIVYAQNKSRFEHLDRIGYPHPYAGDSLSLDCLLHCLLSPFLCAGTMLQTSTRTDIRRRYVIAGDGCTDCATSLCCMSCALTQESMELELEERSFSAPSNIL